MAPTILTDETPRATALAPVRVGTGLDPDALERSYADARAGRARLPWPSDGPNPAFLSWLNADAPGLIRPGSRVVVVGCGLGDDAAELAARGFDVDAFDACPAAVDWARDRHPAIARCITLADARTPPTRWRRRFDLVLAVDLLAWSAPEARAATAEGLASLAHPHGYVLSVEPATGSGHPDDADFTDDEAETRFTHAGLTLVGPTSIADGRPGERWIRALFQPAR